MSKSESAQRAHNKANYGISDFLEARTAQSVSRPEMPLKP